MKSICGIPEYNNNPDFKSKALSKMSREIMSRFGCPKIAVCLQKTFNSFKSEIENEILNSSHFDEENFLIYEGKLINDIKNFQFSIEDEEKILKKNRKRTKFERNDKRREEEEKYKMAKMARDSKAAKNFPFLKIFVKKQESFTPCKKMKYSRGLKSDDETDLNTQKIDPDAPETYPSTLKSLLGLLSAILPKFEEKILIHLEKSCKLQKSNDLLFNDEVFEFVKFLKTKVKVKYDEEKVNQVQQGKPTAAERALNSLEKLLNEAFEQRKLKAKN